MLDGNAGKRAPNADEPQPVGELAEHAPPAWLSESQKEGWRYAMRHAPPGLLKRLDQSVLTVWVCAESVHREASEWVSKKGAMVMGQNGLPYQNPYLAIMNKQAAVMIKAAAEMGFTPSSRSRVKVDPQKPAEGDTFANLKKLTDD